MYFKIYREETKKAHDLNKNEAKHCIVSNAVFPNMF